MSTLIVLGYPSEAEAKSAYQKILDLDKNLIVSLQSIAVVARHADGKYDVVTPGSKVGTSAVWGLFWGVLFGLLFHQYLGMLLIAAVLYLLCAVLVGPAMTCLHGITVKTVRDEPCYMWHEFKKCWKGNWKQSVPAGVLFCTLLAMECIAAWYYMFMQSEMNVLLVAFVAFSLLLLTICWLFTTLQMLYLDMPLGGMLKNSLLIMFGYAKRTLPAGLITLVIVIGVVLFVPVPIMLLLLFLGMPALVAVIGDMWAWPVMEQAFHISEQQAARRAEQEGRE